MDVEEAREFHANDLSPYEAYPANGGDCHLQDSHNLQISNTRNSLLHPSLTTSLAHVPYQVPNIQTRLQRSRDVRRDVTKNLLSTNEDLEGLVAELQTKVTTLEIENSYLRMDARSSTIATSVSNVHGRQTSFTTSSRTFAVMLLDADAYTFRSEYLVDGTNGGHQAADELYRRTSDYLHQELLVPSTEPIQIIVHAYAHCQGLCNALLRFGIIKSEKTFSLFVEAFNQRFPFFEFANVGSGKERADNKIREWLQHYLEQPQCEHIILGCSHDRGYETFLQKFAGDVRSRCKLTMLDGPANSINFRSMGFTKRVAMWTVFATEPISRSNTSIQAQNNIGHDPPSSETCAATDTARVPQNNTHAQGTGKNSHLAPSPPKNQRGTASQPQQRDSQRTTRESSNPTSPNKLRAVPRAADNPRRLLSGPPTRDRQDSSQEPAREVLQGADPARPSIWQLWWQRLTATDALHVR
ncbi:MAG: hypothetical protein Q9162_003185 [Coniocarpon cinnabarinum]